MTDDIISSKYRYEEVSKEVIIVNIEIMHMY